MPIQKYTHEHSSIHTIVCTHTHIGLRPTLKYVLTLTSTQKINAKTYSLRLMHAQLHTHSHTNTHTHTYTPTYIHSDINTLLHANLNTYKHTRAYICTNTNTCAHLCTHRYMHSKSHKNPCTYSLIYNHTHH